MKKFLTTLAVLTVLGSPAFAQSFCTCDGTGNVLKFTNNPITYENRPAAQPPIGQGALSAFAMFPGHPSTSFISDNPIAAGGGSAGYNKNLRNY